MSEPLTVPEWVATLIGRLVLENELLRAGLVQQSAPPEAQEAAK